ncbi:UDP-glycosyltransferase 86A1-like [Henckelia pumila]|uniref:UDP-glycosyltransferase 86A1-like n=1 Tax=Henckelia pumila TaxID=405737 RepID=UPI003C6EA013
MAETPEIRPHAIMIPAPYQGHINPLVDLALNLASRGFTITFVNTKFIHHLLSKSHKNLSDNNNDTDTDMFSEARKSGLDIRYTTISDGFPLDFDRDTNVFEFWEYLLDGFIVHVDELMENMVKSSCQHMKPFLIADTFCTWHAKIANKYNMVDVSFWTEPALMFALDYHLDLLRKNGHYPPPKEDTITYVPGVDPISTKDLMTFLHESDITMEHKVVFRAMEEIEHADFILLNTVEELEPKTVPALTQILPTYAIGPVNLYTRNFKISKSLTQETECTEWLRSKPPSSVLYVSFGSFAHLKGNQVMEEIAHGLLLADVNFIWVVRKNIIIGSDDATDLLPGGFEEKVKGKGLIVPWCDQDSVLSDPGIGGFLTHCGWNSVMESMCHGVPMICFPLLHDQPTNRKLVVDDWKIGINLCDGESVTRDEVAGKIKRLMCTGGFRDESKKVRDVLWDSLDAAAGGSSDRDLARFLEDLRAKIHA